MTDFETIWRLMIDSYRAGKGLPPLAKPCRCEAYPFPHRKYGGKCEAYDPEAGNEEAADRWLMGLMERGYRNIDEKLDDPRRGQAESINRERKP